MWGRYLRGRCRRRRRRWRRVELGRLERELGCRLKRELGWRFRRELGCRLERELGWRFRRELQRFDQFERRVERFGRQLRQYQRRLERFDQLQRLRQFERWVVERRLQRKLEWGRLQRQLGKRRRGEPGLSCFAAGRRQRLSGGGTRLRVRQQCQRGVQRDRLVRGLGLDPLRGAGHGHLSERDLPVELRRRSAEQGVYATRSRLRLRPGPVQLRAYGGRHGGTGAGLAMQHAGSWLPRSPPAPWRRMLPARAGVRLRLLYRRDRHGMRGRHLAQRGDRLPGLSGEGSVSGCCRNSQWPRHVFYATKPNPPETRKRTINGPVQTPSPTCAGPPRARTAKVVRARSFCAAHFFSSRSWAR
jgi:hypothetical protein